MSNESQVSHANDIHKPSDVNQMSEVGYVSVQWSLPKRGIAVSKRGSRGMTATVVILVATILLTACGTPDKDNKNNTNLVPQVIAGTTMPPNTETATPPATAMASATATITGTVQVGSTSTRTRIPLNGTAQVATYEVFATRVSAHRTALKVSAELTHAPTWTPGPPPAFPSPTPMLGILPGCSNASPYGPQAISCWRGTVDGHLVDVGAGHEGLDGNRAQGIVKVHVWGQQGQDVYQTPQTVGPVGIVSVSGNLFTLETIDRPTPMTFVFNLATRQWVSP